MKPTISAFSAFKSRKLNVQKKKGKKNKTPKRQLKSNTVRKATPFRPSSFNGNGKTTPSKLDLPASPQDFPSFTNSDRNVAEIRLGGAEPSFRTDSTRKKTIRRKGKEAEENGDSSVVSPSDDDGFQVVEMSAPPLYMFDSRLEGETCLEWLIHPYKRDKFFRDVWEQKPLLLKRHNDRYYRGLFSTSAFDQILKEKCLWFDKNIDVTTYVDGRRETHNPKGRAHSSVVWDYFNNGCSVRLLNPQTFSRSIWKLGATLQEVFGSFVGANVYLTPAASQGFAPHFDDIEAFVLQLEGRKRWKLYNPRNPNEVLPRFSSENLNDAEIGKPVLEVELEPGDLLYFPRGTIHQAVTPPDSHSLHVTVSTCQRNSWADFLELVVPRTLELARESDSEFRKSLPCNYARIAGIANSESMSPERTEFVKKVKELMHKMIDYLPLDDAVDQMAKRSVHDALPPLLTKEEKRRSIYGNGEEFEGNGRQIVELEPDTNIKLIRSQLIRLVMEEDGVKVYHSADNSREYHKEEIQWVEINANLAPGVEYLLHSYPQFVTVESLPLDTLEEKMEISTLLYDKGLLMTEEVLTPP